MTPAEDALARARAEFAAAEEMGSPEVDLAMARVEQAEEAVRAEGGGECPVCGCPRPACDVCAEECEYEAFAYRALRRDLDDERYFGQY